MRYLFVFYWRVWLQLAIDLFKLFLQKAEVSIEVVWSDRPLE